MPLAGPDVSGGQVSRPTELPNLVHLAVRGGLHSLPKPLVEWAVILAISLRLILVIATLFLSLSLARARAEISFANSLPLAASSLCPSLFSDL